MPPIDSIFTKLFNGNIKSQFMAIINLILLHYLFFACIDLLLKYTGGEMFSLLPFNVTQMIRFNNFYGHDRVNFEQHNN